MKKDIKEKFPKWINEDYNYNLCLSDDIDSFFSCLVLNKIKGYKIGWFYNFKSIYRSVDIEKNKIISVDMDLCNNRRCWGNHVTLKNPNSANLNAILEISRYNYTEKYCGSTLLTILSYYNVDISDLSEKQKMALLAIDSTYLGYWFKDGYYCKKYLKLMELDCLLEVLERHTKQEFKDIDIKYNLNKGKIYINKDGQIKTNIKLDKLQELFPNLSFSLPKNKFKRKREFKIIENCFLKHDEKQIFSCARTYKNALRYSIM
ncbi:hypothetical protein ACQX0N_09355 [Clostridium tepidum]